MSKQAVNMSSTQQSTKKTAAVPKKTAAPKKKDVVEPDTLKKEPVKRKPRTPKAAPALEPEVQEVVIETPTPKTSSKSKAPQKEAKELEDVDANTVDALEAEDKPVRTRRIVNRDTVLDALASFQELVDKEAVKGNTKFVRSVNKRVRLLKNYLSRVLKQKGKHSTPNVNKNSGFLKPVPISNEMSEFTGWTPNQLHSRVEVTKALCDYIKGNNLQNPEDKRKIIPDAKLRKLLSFDPATSVKPLTYFHMQSLIKNHFIKPE